MRLTLLLIPLLFFMTSCTIDWNDEKDKKITELEGQIQELKSDKELELQKFEFEKKKYDESKEKDVQAREDKFRKECAKVKEENWKKFEDFINSCTGAWNTIDFCINSDAWKLLWKLSSDDDFINTCIENKKNWTYQWS